MSVLHELEVADGADAPVVLVALGIESLVRRFERLPPAAPGDAGDTTGGAPTADAPGLVLLGVMSLYRRWRLLRAAMHAADLRRTAPEPRPPSSRWAGSLLR